MSHDVTAPIALPIYVTARKLFEFMFSAPKVLQREQMANVT